MLEASENEPTKTSAVQDENQDFLPGYKNFEEFTREGYKILMEAIKSSNSLPTGRNYSYLGTFESFNKLVNEDGNNIQKLINTILRKYQIQANIRNRGLDEKIELMVDANDTVLEKVAVNIDEMNGIRKTFNEPIVIQTVSAQLPINGSWNRINSATFSVNSSINSEISDRPSNSIVLLTAKNIIRPQSFFKDKIVNSSKSPWEPKIKEKPNSLKPLAIFLEETENGEEFCHPYEFELDRFSLPQDHVQKESPSIPSPVEKTPLIEITEPEQIQGLVDTLMKCKEFAVDLEHHSYRSFMGITCLLQISTKDADYIIDTLTLRDKLYALNEVFTKPTIVKIFHGSDMDVQWLQRDLSIYVVNMFDTYQAARQLELPGLSLAHLMNHYCNFVPNKQFQLADWRIRPLPIELKNYAREDTHYLIYIYQRMKNELLQKANGHDNLLKSVFQKSTNICKKRYFKPVLKDDSYMDFYRKCKRLFDNRQLYVLKELYNWRDHISREEDESTGYVLPNHMLLQISENLPREMQGILACCNPIPPLVRSNLLDIHKLILKGREQPLEKAILKEDTRARGVTKLVSKINMDSPLNCPHDLSNINEVRDDLPTILGKTIINELNILHDAATLEKKSPNQPVLAHIEIEEEKSDEVKTKLNKVTFLGPYQRYKLVRPYVQEQERKALEEAENAKEMEASRIETEKQENDKPTIEQRIETIHQHYITVSRQTIPIKPHVKTSLLGMGGSKKRKRVQSPGEDEFDYSNSSSISTPVPNIHKDINNKKRKNDNSDEASPPKLFKNNSPVKSNTEKKRKKKKQFWRNKLNTDSPQNQISESLENNQGLEDSFQDADNQSNRNKNVVSKKKRNRLQNRNKQQKQNLNRSEEFQEESFTPYDYSAVDYNQFQGGAATAKAPQGFKFNFKNKGKNKKGNKGQNRSSIHGGSNFPHFRGRGR